MSSPAIFMILIKNQEKCNKPTTKLEIKNEKISKNESCSPIFTSIGIIDGTWFSNYKKK